MINFIVGIQSIFLELVIFLRSLSELQMVWGFVLGFLISTLVHGFLMTEKPHHIPIILMNQPGISFERIHQIDAHRGHYRVSFRDFLETVNKVKMTFGIAGVLFMFSVLLALFKF